MNRRRAWWQIAVTGVLVLSLTIACVLHTPQTFSLSERRSLAQFPTLDVSSLMSGKFMTDFEKYTLDQFPMRDAFRSLKGWVSKYIFLQTDNNDLYEHNGVVTKMEYPMREDSIEYACRTFDRVYEQYLQDTDCNVYLSLIPDKNAFYAQDSGHLAMDYAAFFEQMQQGMPFAQYIDIAPLLSGDDYYATDTHWRQEHLVDVSNTLAAGMGVTLPDKYTEHTADVPFQGVYCGQYGLPLEPDTMRYLTNDLIDGMTVHDLQNDRTIPMYDEAKLTDVNGYELFVGGSLSLITIENPQINTQKELVIFRDSFCASVAPLLAQGYSKVTLVDIRYIPSASLDTILTFDDQDVLFLYSTLVLNNSHTLK